MARSVDNEDQAKKLQEREQRKRDRHAADIAWLLNDVRGRRLYWHWLGNAHIFKTSFTGNSETFFREGERNIGLKMLDDLNAHCPQAYVLMQQEAADELKQDRDFQKDLEDAQQKEKL